jgi:hypothetical protein
MTCDQNISIADLIALRDNRVASDRSSQDLSMTSSFLVRLAQMLAYPLVIPLWLHPTL